MSPATHLSPPLPRHRPERWRGVWIGVGLFVLLYALLYSVWTIYHWGGEANVSWIANLANVPPGFIATLAAWRVALDRRFEPGLRRAWLILGLAVLSSAIGEAVWFYYDSVLNLQPFPSLADAFYLPFYPLVLLGLAVFPNAPLSRDARSKFWLDLAIVMTAAAMYTWYFIAVPAMKEAESDLLSQLLALAYPVGDLIAMTGIVALVFRRIDRTARGALLLFSLGLILTLGSDLFFAFASLTAEYAPGNFLESGFVAAYALYTLAALQQASTAGGLDFESDRLSRRLALVLPFVAIVVGFGLALYALWAEPALNEQLRGLFVGAVLLALLVTGRQLAELRENKLLNAKLRKTADELLSMSDNLEQRVAARTRDLQLASEVGQAVAQERDLDRLLARAVGLIQARFDLYAVQIFLSDAAGRNLTLRAATGEGAAEWLGRAQPFNIDMNSIPGAAAVERREVLVPDAAISPIFHANPLLPKTRAELAVSLQIRDRLLGVLDLQADRHGVLTRANAGVFESLTGPLAIAIENALLFEQAEHARREVEAQARRLTRTGWEDYLDAVHKPERMEYTYASGAAPAEDAPQLSAPIEVAGESVGGLQVVGAAEREWTPEDEALLQAVSHQVAEQVENLRLLAQADQYRTEAEHAVRRMTRDGWTNFAERSETPSGFIYDAETVAPETSTGALVSAVTHPLIVRGEAIGEIAVEVEGLSAEAQRLIATVAEQLSAHVESLRLLNANQAALAETETLYNLNARLSAAATLEDILRATAEPGIEAGANDARLFLLELDAAGEPQVAALVATWQREGAPVMPVGTRFNTADFSFSRLWIADKHNPFVVADAQTEVRFDDAARSVFMQTQAIGSIILPLTLAGKWLGLVLVNWTGPHAFTDSEVRLYRALAGQAAVVLNNRLLFEDAQRRARRETIINTITQRIQNTVSIESALQTAVQEVGVALKAQQTRVEFGLSPSEPRNDGNGGGQPARRES